jgi:hypothetical protein
MYTVNCTRESRISWMRYRNSTLKTAHVGRVEPVVLQVEIAVYNLPRTVNVGDKHRGSEDCEWVRFLYSLDFRA